MLAALVAIAFGGWIALAGAGLARATEPAAQDEAEKPESEFKPPPGYKAKKRGDVTLYCTRGKATGTRFQTESCYDEAQLRDYLLAREQYNRDFDRTRAICANPAMCAPE